MNILYYITHWEVGTAYKNIQFMKETFGGEIIKDNISKALKYIRKNKPEIIVVRGDGRQDYKLALRFKIPYILIENDVSSMRSDLNEEGIKEEKTKIENASAIIFTSEDHAEYCKKYNLPYYEIIYSRPLKKDLDFKPLPKTLNPTLVYAGGIGNSWDSRNGDYGYRCYQEIIEKFTEAGWEVHLYPASNKKLSGYNCKIHNKLPYNELLREMSQYWAGLHIYNKEGVPEKAYNYTQVCRGNKIWDYLGAGIPTIGYQGGKGMDIYRNKWGIVLRSLNKESINRIPERLKKIKITDQMRYENVMDNDLDKFRNVIEVALKARKELDKLPTPIMPKIEWDETDMVIQVTNKTPRRIERGNYIFEPYKTTEPFIVNKSQWKEIKANVGLRILYIQEGKEEKEESYVSSESSE